MKITFAGGYGMKSYGDDAPLIALAQKFNWATPTLPQNWLTVEEPLHLPEAILENSPKADVMLVDCLTLWVSNLLMETDDEEKSVRQDRQLLVQVGQDRLGPDDPLLRG